MDNSQVKIQGPLTICEVKSRAIIQNRFAATRYNALHCHDNTMLETLYTTMTSAIQRRQNCNHLAYMHYHDICDTTMPKQCYGNPDNVYAMMTFVVLRQQIAFMANRLA